MALLIIVNTLADTLEYPGTDQNDQECSLTIINDPKRWIPGAKYFHLQVESNYSDEVFPRVHLFRDHPNHLYGISGDEANWQRITIILDERNIPRQFDYTFVHETAGQHTCLLDRSDKRLGEALQ